MNVENGSNITGKGGGERKHGTKGGERKDSILVSYYFKSIS